ncbi:sulfotransferase domain-containing protein [Lysinibacillus sphaericus]
MMNESKIMINSIPKSGTHLLLQLILGYSNTTKYRWIFKEEEIKDIKPGEVILAHLEHSKTAQKLISDNNIKMIFLYRDLRDISVSLLHFILKNQYNHPMNPYLVNKLSSNDQRLLAIIKGGKQNPSNPNSPFIIPPIDYYARKKVPWLTEEKICKVSFEELRRSESSLDNSLKKIVMFINGNPSVKKEIITRMKSNVKASKSDTFRKGQIGDWKKEFKEIHKNSFKQVANDLLISYGYETNNKW